MEIQGYKSLEFCFIRQISFADENVSLNSKIAARYQLFFSEKIRNRSTWSI